MPDMTGKIIVTNTVTEKDVEMLKRRGEYSVTTTPDSTEGLLGRRNEQSRFLSGKRPEDLEEKSFRVINKVNLKPRVEYLNGLTKLRL